MVQTIVRTEPTEVSHETSDDFWIRGGRPDRCRNHHAAVALAFPNHPVPTADTTSPRAAAGAKKLPIEEFEDMSLVHSAVPKR
jgi:hypothetical protein